MALKSFSESCLIIFLSLAMRDVLQTENLQNLSLVTINFVPGYNNKGYRFEDKNAFCFSLQMYQNISGLTPKIIIACAGLLLTCIAASGQLSFAPPERAAMNSLEKKNWD